LDTIQFASHTGAAMNAPVSVQRLKSTCPHDCPSACSLEVEVIDGKTIGRVHGDPAQSYTAGVVCAKVARYAERIHHPDRLLHPLIRKGPKGSGSYQRISWDEALAMTAEKFLEAEKRYGAETVWPYYYAGTMGFVQRDGINRLRHVKKYSGFYSTICTNMAWSGFIAGTGRLAGVDPREMALADVVVIWGTNPVSTQVNVMTHAMKARKERGAKIVVVDIYRTDTVKQADLGLVLKPGTDAALACAVMHVLFRDGFADRDYLRDFTDVPAELESHLESPRPRLGCRHHRPDGGGDRGLRQAGRREQKDLLPPRLRFRPPAQRRGEHARRLLHSGRHRRLEIRGGRGLPQQRRHLSLAQVAHRGTGREGCGGAHPRPVPHRRHSHRRGRGAAPARRLRGAAGDRAPHPEHQSGQRRPRTRARSSPGLPARTCFTVVHEQFMTDTAKMADLVLPATQFMEHDDMYQGGGHQHIMLGLKLIDPPGECRSNHELITDLAGRLGAEHPGFAMTPREIIDWTLQKSGWGTFAELEATNFRDVQPKFEEAHYLKGFAYGDRKFRFKPDWPNVPYASIGTMGPVESMPSLPDHWAVTEEPDATYPFKLATSPSRSYLNSSFAETPSSRKREGRPEVMVNPADAERLGIAAGVKVELGSPRGTVILHAKVTDQTRPGTLIAEGLWANADHEGGRGINMLTGADAVAPFGGAAFHDNKVWIRLA
jgi:anaerobic selenocysteine-containing dehydrogenase